MSDERRPTISRRSLLLGAAGVVAAAVGVPVTLAARRPKDLVTRLQERHPFVVAHRGGDDDWPEMSLLAYRSALALGVDAVEVSLARTRDGVWFGLHDATLDRTSGVHAMVAEDQTWAQVSKLAISGASTHTPAQPYARLEDVVTTVAGRCPIFVDPKVAQHHGDELLDLLAHLAANPQATFVAKGQIGQQEQWAASARTRGYQTWGFTYAAQLVADPTSLAHADAWTMLGLDVRGDPQAWAIARQLGRPLIAHTVVTRTDEQTALDRGAVGLMASDVKALLAPSAS